MNYWDAPYVGLMDELKIYDEPLEAETAQMLYAKGQASKAELTAEYAENAETESHP